MNRESELKSLQMGRGSRPGQEGHSIWPDRKLARRAETRRGNEKRFPSFAPPVVREFSREGMCQPGFQRPLLAACTTVSASVARACAAVQGASHLTAFCRRFIFPGCDGVRGVRRAHMEV